MKQATSDLPVSQQLWPVAWHTVFGRGRGRPPVDTTLTLCSDPCPVPPVMGNQIVSDM